MKTNKISRMILLGATLSIGFSSCQFANKYKTPEVDATNLYREQLANDTTTIANIPWDQYFRDPILVRLIQEGIEKNHDLRASYETIKQAEAGLSMARAAYFPDVALVGNVNYTQTSVGSDGSRHVLGGMQQKQYTLGIAASWELDVWGKINRQSRAQYAQFLSSHAYKNLIQTSLISNIATSYYALLALDEQLRITRETVGLMEESTATMQALKDAGMLNGAAVEQSKGLLYGTKVSVPALEAQVRELENTICLLLGRKPGPIARTTIGEQYVPEQMQFGVPVQMLSKRPDVLQAELAFRNAFELKNVAQASFYPTISISSGTLGYTHNTLSSFFKPEHILANVVGGLTQPLFARKQLISNLKIAKSREAESLIRFEQSVLAASIEVSDIFYNYQSSLKKNADRKEQVQSLNTAVYYTKELLKAGEANYTEVLQAEQGLLQAQMGQVSDKLEQLQQSVNMYRALGGGAE